MPRSQWLRCKGDNCPNSLPLDPADKYCMHCGTLNPEFDETLLVKEWGKTLAHLQQTDCTLKMHRKSAREILKLADEDEMGVEKLFCVFCGTVLISNGQSAVAA